MNIVLLTCNYLPDTSPEAPCASRFANGLARAGHKVTVVAWDQAGRTPTAICKQIQTENVNVIRLPAPQFANPFFALVNRLLRFQDWSVFGNLKMVSMLRNVLCQIDAPILISRSDPAQSTLVALKCRKYAARWIAHFSDVMPFGIHSRVRGFVNWMVRRIVGRALKTADIVAVTCPNAARWFREKYELCSDEAMQKFIVCTHVGDPLLQPVPDYRPQFCEEGAKIVSHCGYLGGMRYVDRISDALSHVACAEKLLFALVGNFGASTLSTFERKGIRTIGLPCDDPGKVTRINECSDVILVADTDPQDVAYSPFLPSKFVYALFTETPIVACSIKDSEMFRLAELFPTAGIYRGNVRVKGSVEEALQKALARGNVAATDRAAIRKYFGEERVIGEYLSDLERLGVPAR